MFRYESDRQISRREQAKTEAMFKKAASNASDIQAYNSLAYSQKSAQTQQKIQQVKEIKEAEEGFRKREAEREEARLAELERQMKLAEESENSITASGLYQNGLEARLSHQGIEAATLFWQALICGESRAAYPLFEMLRDGESGVGKNMEMAGIILDIGRNFLDSNCIAIRGIPNSHERLSSKIKIACNKVKKTLPENINQGVIEAQEVIISALMDQCILKTRQDEEPMTSVFAHDDVEEVQVEVSGGNDSGGNSCILM